MQYFYSDDGTLVATGDEAIVAFNEHLDRTNAQRRAALRKMSPAALHAYKLFLTGTPQTTSKPRERHDAPSRRGTRSTSSSSDDPDPPAKPCACGCGRPRAAGKRHHSDVCRRADARGRKQRQRDRDRANPDRVAERDARRLHGWRPEDEFVRCEGHDHGHAEIAFGWPDDDELCALCGRWLRPPTASVNGYADMRSLMEAASAASFLARPPIRPLAVGAVQDLEPGR